ncbi:alpha-galactosidase [bacterium]|nr:alpha-galactosidase [bacterium]
MKKSFLFICIFFLASYVWAGFINEPRAPYEPFTTKRKENKVTGYYDNKILFEIVCDTSERIYSTYNSSDILQSYPMTQVRTIVFDDRKTHELMVNLYLSAEAGVMRSKRASGGEAILGRVGDPLIKGISGVYDIRRDFLLEWFGADWEWFGNRMIRDENGNLSASFKATVTNGCFNLVFRPNYYSVGLSYRNFKPWVRRPNLKSVNGWCSWEAYRGKINMENIKEICSLIKNSFYSYGMDTVQIDNGYCGGELEFNDRFSLADCWMRPSGKFPDGPASIAKTIASYDLTPGIWMSPGVSVNQQEQRLRLPNGRPVSSNWIRGLLDMSDYTITNTFVPVFQAFKDAGFKYLKVDGLRHVLYEGLILAYDADEATRRIRNFGLAARLTLGDDFYLMACWGIMPELTDSIDACRVASDCGDDFISHHRQLYYFAEMFPLNRVLFVNDPDHMVMKADPEWGKSKVSTVSLGGGTYMFSDKPEDLDKERIYILQRGLPSLETYPMESGPLHTDHPTYYPYKDIDESKEEDAMYRVGPRVEPGVESPFSTLWAVHFAKDWGCWCVVTRNALWSLEESVVGFEKLGLDPKKTYLAYDFWEKKFLGEVKEGLPMKALKYGSCQVVGLREKLDRPQFVVSTRHVSMDAVSVKDIAWKDNTLSLKLVCVEGTVETYSFYVPEGYKFDKAECEGGEAKVIEGNSDRLLEIEVSAKKKDIALNLKFN